MRDILELFFSKFSNSVFSFAHQNFGRCYSETLKLGFLVCFPLFLFLNVLLFLVFSTSSLVVSIRYCPFYCL